ncbi:MAG: FAD-dependent oxidoreductase [Herbiconiux sp.]|nr:FAD-dependent oxidoreductase [Herbiconiux sp.]
MGRRVDTIVVGGGATGSAAAWQLARRGAEVVLLERLDPPGTPAASPAPPARSLLVDRAEPERLRLAADSLRLWRELEDETGTPLLGVPAAVGNALTGAGPHRRGHSPTATALGGVLHGHPTDPDDLLRVLPRFGFDLAELHLDEAGERWPGVRFEGRVLHSPQFSAIDPVRAIAALQHAARRHGASVEHRRRVTRIRVLGDDRALVEVAPTDATGTAVGDSDGIECRRLVVAAGAWTGRLLGAVLVLPRLSVTENAAIRLHGTVPHAAVPLLRHIAGAGDARHGDWRGAVEVVPAADSVTIGFTEGGGAQVDPDSAGARNDRHRRRSPLLRFARDRLSSEFTRPDADPVEEIRRLHTASRDGRLTVDRVGPVAVAAGLSGNGLALAPAVGTLLAGLAAGVRAPAPFSVRPDRRGSGAPVAR